MWRPYLILSPQKISNGQHSVETATQIVVFLSFSTFSAIIIWHDKNWTYLTTCMPKCCEKLMLPSGKMRREVTSAKLGRSIEGLDDKWVLPPPNPQFTFSSCCTAWFDGVCKAVTMKCKMHAPPNHQIALLTDFWVWRTIGNITC